MADRYTMVDSAGNDRFKAIMGKRKSINSFKIIKVTSNIPQILNGLENLMFFILKHINII